MQVFKGTDTPSFFQKPLITSPLSSMSPNQAALSLLADFGSLCAVTELPHRIWRRPSTLQAGGWICTRL